MDWGDRPQAATKTSADKESIFGWEVKQEMKQMTFQKGNRPSVAISTLKHFSISYQKTGCPEMGVNMLFAKHTRIYLWVSKNATEQIWVVLVVWK